jgi:hypothetical protein
VIREKDGPWTNGDVMEPTARATNGILALGGNPNIWSLTIETEGSSGDNPPKAQLNAIVWQVRDWMARYDIPLTNVIRHADINQVSRGFCPGDALFNKVREAAGDGTDHPGVCPFFPPPPFDGTDKLVNNIVFHADERTVECAVDELNCRQFAEVGACLTRGPLTMGEKFKVQYWVQGQSVSGEDRWWVTPAGSRVWAGGTIEKPA